MKTLIPVRAGWLQDANTMLVSAVCHLSLLLVIALLATAHSSAPSGTKLVVQLGTGQDSTATVEPLAVDDSPIGSDSPAAGGSPLPGKVKIETAFEPASAIGTKPVFAEPTLAAGGLVAGTAHVEASAVSRLLFGPGLGGGKGGGRGDEGSSAKAATEFFGIGGYGESFVYVVDCSGSMNQNGKFDRARYELLQSIEKLNKDQSYFVIFFNHKAHPMDGGRLVLATPGRVTETVHWVNDVEASGGTNPLPSLLYALSLHPDAIYFLSDGEFDPNTIQELRLRNRPNNRLHTKATPIHTIAFYDRFAAGLMRTIARNAGGEFRFMQ